MPGLGDGVLQVERHEVGRAAGPHAFLDLGDVGLVRLGHVGGETDDPDAVFGQPAG